MNKPPAFQFYAKDIYTGTSDLSPAEFGAYVRGLAWSWDNGPLPLDPSRRARVLLTDTKEHAAIWPVISCLWMETPEGWINFRLEKQRQESTAHRQRQADKGHRSATGRQPEHQPDVNRKSAEQPTEQQPKAQPEGNSSSAPASALALSDLPSASAEHARTPDAPGWRTAPRPTPLVASAHLGCFDAPAACARGLCVQPVLAKRWRAQLGFDPSANDAYIRRVVNEAIDTLPPGPIGDDPLKFWTAVWSAKHGSQAPAPAPIASSRESVAAHNRRESEELLQAVNARPGRTRGELE